MRAGLASLLQPCAIDVVFTSPPYPNEKDYTRATRLESVVLGLIKNKGDSNAPLNKDCCVPIRGNVYKHDDDDCWDCPQC